MLGDDSPVDSPVDGEDVEQDGRGPVYQPRCVFCGLEHYVLNVISVSNGASGCHNCGRVPPVFYDQAAYYAALREGREIRAAERLTDG